MIWRNGKYCEGGKVRTSDDVGRIITPRTHECITLYGKMGFAEVVKAFEMGRSFWDIRVSFM